MSHTCSLGLCGICAAPRAIAEAVPLYSLVAVFSPSAMYCGGRVASGMNSLLELSRLSLGTSSYKETAFKVYEHVPHRLDHVVPSL